MRRMGPQANPWSTPKRQHDPYPRPSKWGRIAKLELKNRTSTIGLVIALLALAGAGFVFIQVQVLPSYPFYSGVFGTRSLFLSITYTASLEIFVAVAGVGLFARTYSKSTGTTNSRIMRAAGNTMMIMGLVIATIVYVETQLLWGEVIPGVHLWQGLPGGGGYPWGAEQVASNTCLVPSSTAGDCTFLNYDELFWLAAACAVVGYFLMHLRPKLDEE
jgi:hypothetical protein